MDVIASIVATKRSSYEAVVNDASAHPQPTKTHKANYMADIVSGAFAGMAVVLSGHPFDTVKVRMQGAEQRGIHFTNSIDCFLRTLKKEGVRGLYKGMSAPLVCSTAVDAVFFFTNEQAKRHFQPSPNTPMDIPYYFLAGGVAGGMTSLITTPMELVKSRLQMQMDTSRTHIQLPVTNEQLQAGGILAKPSTAYRGPLDVLKRTFTSEGIPGLYRGLLPTFLRDVPLIGTYFGIYEVARRALAGWPQDYPHHYHPITTLTAGGIAGVASWALVYPVDGIKSRVQTQVGAHEPTWQLALGVVKRGGMNGLYRGFMPCVLRAFPVNAACFFVFENCHSLLLS